MVSSGRVAYLARRGAEYGLKPAPKFEVDMNVVRNRKREIVDSFRGGSEARVEKAENLDWLKGVASFSGDKELDVKLNEGGTKKIKAEKIFIDVGCRPAKFEVPGVESVDVLDSTSVMELDVVPEHLVVVGGGYVGLEFAQLFRRLGSRVTVIQRGSQLLPREDQDIAETVQKILEEDGLEILLNASTQKVAKSGGKITIDVKSEGKSSSLEASHILAAAGRTPNTDKLNLSATGVNMSERGFVTVDDKLQTNVEGIYAIGDVNGGPMFTHISYDDFRVFEENVIQKGNATRKDRMEPYTVFMDPQLGRIGLTEKEAKKKGLKVRIAKIPMTWVARALEINETRGLLKAVVDTDTKQILGCACLGIEGGELMAMIQIAMMGKLPYTALQTGIFAHPTLAESLNNLFSNFAD